MAGEKGSIGAIATGGARASGISIGRSAGAEGFAARASSFSSIARPDISLPSSINRIGKVSEGFTPKSPLGARRITPLSVDGSEIRTPVPRNFGAYAPMELFHRPADTVSSRQRILPRAEVLTPNVVPISPENRGSHKPVSSEQVRTLREQSQEQALQLLQRSLQPPQLRDRAREPQIVWNYRSGRRETPIAAESQRQIPTVEMQRPSVVKPEVLVQPDQSLEGKSNVTVLKRETEILNELAQISERQAPPEVSIPIKTADVVPIILLRVTSVAESAIVDNPQAEQSLDPAPKQKKRKTPQDAGWYLFEKRFLEKRRAEKKKKEFQLTQPYEIRITAQTQQSEQSSEKMKSAIVVTVAAQRQTIEQPVSILQQQATVSSADNSSTLESAETAAASNNNSKEKNGKVTLVKNLIALGINVQDVIQKIYFKVDKITQAARRRILFAAIERNKDANNMVNGEPVAAALGNESRGNLISALLRKLGYSGKENFIDGSITVVKDNIAKIGIQKLKVMRKIVMAETENTPAVDANENPDGPLVGKQEVETVLGETPNEKLPIAA